MDTRDARTLTQDAQHELRMTALRMVLNGQTQTVVAAHLQVSRQALSGWMIRYRAGGWAALSKGQRGRRQGQKRKLTSAQEREVQKLITDHTPDQMKMSFALWNRDAVRLLIERRYGIRYGLPMISRLLKRWGFTPQRPVRKAYEQRPAAVRQWLDEVYPQVAAKAQAEGAQIWWADETAVKPECHYRRGYAPKGKTPEVRQAAKRFHSSLISAINNRGYMEWMALDQPLNAEVFIRFLGQLIKNRARKVYLVVDNLRVHHSQRVKEWIEPRKAQIELVYLPSYSPELNPDEYLNNHLKQTVTKDGAPRTKDELDAEVWVGMVMLKMNRPLVRRFFRHPNVQYAA
jgi:transposase